MIRLRMVITSLTLTDTDFYGHEEGMMGTALKILGVLLTLLALVFGFVFVMFVLVFVVAIGAMGSGARGPRIQSYHRY